MANYKMSEENKARGAAVLGFRGPPRPSFFSFFHTGALLLHPHERVSSVGPGACRWLRAWQCPHRGCFSRSAEAGRRTNCGRWARSVGALIRSGTILLGSIPPGPNDRSRAKHKPFHRISGAGLPPGWGGPTISVCEKYIARFTPVKTFEGIADTGCLSRHDDIHTAGVSVYYSHGSQSPPPLARFRAHYRTFCCPSMLRGANSVPTIS